MKTKTHKQIKQQQKATHTEKEFLSEAQPYPSAFRGQKWVQTAQYYTTQSLVIRRECKNTVEFRSFKNG